MWKISTAVQELQVYEPCGDNNSDDEDGDSEEYESENDLERPDEHAATGTTPRFHLVQKLQLATRIIQFTLQTIQLTPRTLKTNCEQSKTSAMSVALVLRA